MGAKRFEIPVTSVPSAWRLLATAAIASAIALGARRYSMANDESRWLVVATDSGVRIAVDVAHIEHRAAHSILIWYRTDHDVMRYYKEKAFNREIVQALLQCDAYTFRIVSTEMSVRGGRTVMRQASSNGELSRQPWRRVEAGSAESDAARAACRLADRASR